MYNPESTTSTNPAVDNRIKIYISVVIYPLTVIYPKHFGCHCKKQ